jgi:hypothetical protein
MARQNYQRLSPADVDEIWVRMRAGHAVEPTARSLDWRPAQSWERVTEELQSPPRTWTERVAARLGLSDRVPCWSLRHRRCVGPGCSRCCSVWPSPL